MKIKSNFFIQFCFAGCLHRNCQNVSATHIHRWKRVGKVRPSYRMVHWFDLVVWHMYSQWLTAYLMRNNSHFPNLHHIFTFNHQAFHTMRFFYFLVLFVFNNTIWNHNSTEKRIDLVKYFENYIQLQARKFSNEKCTTVKTRYSFRAYVIWM